MTTLRSVLLVVLTIFLFLVGCNKAFSVVVVSKTSNNASKISPELCMTKLTCNGKTVNVRVRFLKYVLHHACYYFIQLVVHNMLTFFIAILIVSLRQDLR